MDSQSDSCSPCASAEQNSQLEPLQDICPSCPCRVTPVPTLPEDSGACWDADPVKIPNSGEEILSSGEKIPSSGEKIPNCGEEILNCGEEIPNSGEKIPNCGEKIPNCGEEILSSGEKIPNCGEKIPNCGEEAFTIETPGMCLMKFPLQNSILAVEVCPFPLPEEEEEELGEFGISRKNLQENLEKKPQEERAVPEIHPGNVGNLQEIPKSPPELCGLEVVEVGKEEIRGEIPTGIRGDWGRSQGFGGSGAPEDCRSQNSPFRLNSATSSVVERCLARCQSWFRGQN